MLLFALYFALKLLYSNMVNKFPQNKVRGLVDRKLVEPTPSPSNFIAGRPKAALLFCFFGDL